MVITRNFNEKLPKPYSECDIDTRTATINSVDSELFQRVFATNKSYEQQICFHYAYRTEVYLNCGCVVEIGDVDAHEQHVCFTNSEQDCRVYQYNIAFQQKRFNGKYDSACPLECFVADLTYKSSLESFPAYHYANYLLNSNKNFTTSLWLHKELKVDDIVDSISRVNIYYDKIGHEVLQEVATMTVLNLLANTGGMLGLFLGSSILTFAEIIQVLIQICQSYFTSLQII